MRDLGSDQVACLMTLKTRGPWSRQADWCVRTNFLTLNVLRSLAKRDMVEEVDLVYSLTDAGTVTAIDCINLFTDNEMPLPDLVRK